MESSAARPPKAAPYPHAGGHGNDGAVDQSADDAGKRALHPGNGDNHPGTHKIFQVGEGAVQPGHAHIIEAHYLALPSASAVSAASATGISLVPPVATMMRPVPVGFGMAPTMPTPCPSHGRQGGSSFPTSSAASGDIR